jgi:cytochrome c5
MLSLSALGTPYCQEKNVKKIIMKICSYLLLVGISCAAVATPCNRLSDPMTEEAIADRIKPIGMVVAEGASTVAAGPAQPKVLGPKAGEERYKSTCAVCHATGVAGAPKFRDDADWKSRTGAGLDGMLAIAIKGKGGMPPRGTCMQCSDEELKAAIKYMIPQK